MNLQTVFFLLLASVCLVDCGSLILGDSNNKELIHHKTIQYNAFLDMRITKHVFYKDDQKRTITAIEARENLRSNATATITTGGIGYSYVNIRMDSEQGKALEYDVDIYS